MTEKTRSLEHLEFYCTECNDPECTETDDHGTPAVKGSGGPREFESRRDALLHNKATGHRVVGKIIYMYDYPHRDITLKMKEEQCECKECMIG